MSAPSKNQRSGPRSKQRPTLCPKGHECTWVHVASRGRKKMKALCECDGYFPIGKETR